MSNFTSNRDAEINYWPSVSDMFLVFFIIALCIVSTMYSSYSDGEKEIIDEVVFQSNVLFKTCGQKGYEVTMDKADETNRPELACKLMESALHIRNNRKAVNDIEIPQKGAVEYRNYREAVLFLIKLVGDESEIEKAEVTDSARLLDFVNAHVTGKQLYAKIADQEEETPRDKTKAELSVLDEVIYQTNQLSQALGVGDVYSRGCETMAKRPKLAALLMKIEEKLHCSTPYTADYKPKYIRWIPSENQLLEAASDYQLAVDWLYRGVVSSCVYQENAEFLDCGRKLDVVHAKINGLSLFEQLLEKNEYIAVLEANTRISRVVMDGKDLEFFGNSVAVLRYPQSAVKQAIQELCNTLADSLKEVDESKINRQVVEIIGHTDSSSSSRSFADFFNRLKRDEGRIPEKITQGRVGQEAAAEIIVNSVKERFNTSDSADVSFKMEAVGSGNAALGLARAIRYEEELKSAILNRLAEGATNADIDEYKRRLNSGKYLQFRCYSAAQLYPEDSNNSTAHENRRIEVLVRKMQESEIPK